MEKVYVVSADCGGCFVQPHDCVVKIFADKDKAEAFKEHFVNSPELLKDYDELNAVYVVEYDVE